MLRAGESREGLNQIKNSCKSFTCERSRAMKGATRDEWVYGLKCSMHSVWLHSQFVHVKLIKDASGVVFRRLKKHSPALSIPSRLLSHCHLLIFPRTPKHFILLPNKRHYSKTACLKILSSAMKQKKTFTLPPQLVEAVKQKGEQVKAETHTNEPSSNVAFFLFINIFVLTFSDGFPFCFRTPHYVFEKKNYSFSFLSPIFAGDSIKRISF